MESWGSVDEDAVGARHARGAGDVDQTQLGVLSARLRTMVPPLKGDRGAPLEGDRGAPLNGHRALLKELLIQGKFRAQLEGS